MEGYRALAGLSTGLGWDRAESGKRQTKAPLDPTFPSSGTNQGRHPWISTVSCRQPPTRCTLTLRAHLPALAQCLAIDR